MTARGPVHLVDDDADVRAALSLLLRTVGLRAETYADPAAFLARLPAATPGPILLDLRMPVMSGLQLEAELTARGCAWPVILLTGHGGLDACRRAFKAGAVDFLTKPVDEEALIEAVQGAYARLAAGQSRAAEREEARALLARLTEREREVLGMVAGGQASTLPPCTQGKKVARPRSSLGRGVTTGFQRRQSILVAPGDVGVGISQMVPVIVASLRKQDGVLGIEQPELHVHPAIQVGMGDLFIKAVAADQNGLTYGKTLIIETHSEHIMLRLLRRVREQTEGAIPPGVLGLTPDDLSVIYVEGSVEGVRFRPLRVGPDGDFVDRWPRGFFAERAEELF